MKRTDIEQVANKFKTQSKPEDRYTSFDYCYNYFKTTKDHSKDIEKSCLTLGFYLASWGMFRGSSFLLKRSAKHFQTTVEYIASLDKSVWEIDVDNYGKNNIQTIIKIYKDIKALLILNGNSDLTLITKIQLGVFGFIPAFDSKFCNTFREITNGKCGFRKVNEKSLTQVKTFYDTNKSTIDKLSADTYTTEFLSGEKTRIKYTKAKIIDMYGFALKNR